MRYSAQHKAKTRERLIRKAAERLRGKGMRGAGIAQLMRELGLTHGGFYGHFANKDDLVAAATNRMLGEGMARMKSVVEAAPAGQKVAAIVNGYLSKEHRDHPEQGCLLSTLAAEIARQPQAVRQAYTRGFNGQIKAMAEYMPGADGQERCERARLLLGGMAGSMMLARSVSDRRLSDKILEQARKFYLSTFEGI